MLFNKTLNARLNTLEREIRKLKATLPLPNATEYNTLILDKDTLKNFNHHIKRLNEEFDDALQHLKLARVILERRDDK